MATADILLIIAAVSVGIVNIIAALKVNHAASAAVTTIETLRAEVAALTKLLAEERARR